MEEEDKLLTMEEVKAFFRVKSTQTIQKFINEGLPCFSIGSKDKRFSKKDIIEFVEARKKEEQLNRGIKPIKKKAKYHTLNIDFEKKRINLEENRVV